MFLPVQHLQAPAPLISKKETGEAESSTET
jgi:hypothetical protein